MVEIYWQRFSDGALCGIGAGIVLAVVSLWRLLG